MLYLYRSLIRILGNVVQPMKFIEVWSCDCDSGRRVRNLIPVKISENNCMWMWSAAWNELKLQVRETFSCTIVRESAAEFFLPSGDLKVGQRLLKHAIPWFFGVGVWYWTQFNSTHGPSRVLGMLLECPCATPLFSLFLLWVYEAILPKP